MEGLYRDTKDLSALPRHCLEEKWVGGKLSSPWCNPEAMGDDSR
jgi:hypothetical protein